MNSDRFDLFARRLGTVTDRRRVLRLTLSSTIALVLASLRGRGAAQTDCAERCPPGKMCVDGACVRGCRNDRDCRSKHDDPCILNACADGRCVQAIVDCLPGYQCCKGECCPSGCSVDIDCAVLDPCLWGRCGIDGQCVFTELDPCVICESDVDCSSSGLDTICCDGACHRPCPEGTVMGKGCECSANGSANLNGPVVRDDASG